jgi:methionyl-tRNA formyltransferase
MRIVFMGTPQAAVPSLERLIQDGHEIVAVYTQPDRPSGRGNKIAMPPVKEAALGHGLSVYQPLKIKTSEAFEEFRAHTADVAIVVAYGRILPESFLTAFPNGAINVHFSLLPKYRGAAPVNWAIVNGEKFTGVTTMQMDAGLDTGNILLQSSTEIRPNETSVELVERLAIEGAELLAETLENLDSLQPKTQDHSLATLAPIMQKDDGIIDWKMTAQSIARRVRGFQPFPTAYTRFDNKKLTLWAAEPSNQGSDLAPATIVEAKADDLWIACGDRTVLQVSELQLEGKRRMSVRDFINGVKVAAGTKLG